MKAQMNGMVGDTRLVKCSDDSRVYLCRYAKWHILLAKCHGAVVIHSVPASAIVKLVELNKHLTCSESIKSPCQAMESAFI